MGRAECAARHGHRHRRGHRDVCVCVSFVSPVFWAVSRSGLGRAMCEVVLHDGTLALRSASDEEFKQRVQKAQQLPWVAGWCWFRARQQSKKCSTFSVAGCSN